MLELLLVLKLLLVLELLLPVLELLSVPVLLVELGGWCTSLTRLRWHR